MKQRATLCSVEHRHNQCLLLDTRFIEPFRARPGSIFQFIGELDSASSDDHPVLRARVVRCVDGMDVAMYNKALDAQRKFFEGRETNSAVGSEPTWAKGALKRHSFCSGLDLRLKWAHIPKGYSIQSTLVITRLLRLAKIPQVFCYKRTGKQRNTKQKWDLGLQNVLFISRPSL